MSRRFTTGCEESSAAAGATLTMWTTIGASITIESTGTPHSGTYYCRAPSGVTGIRKQLAAEVTSGTYYTRFYWKPATLPTAGTSTRIMTVQSTGGTTAYTVNHTRSTNALMLQQAIAPTNSVDTTATVAANTWYRIEVEHVLHDTTGSLTLRLYEGDAVTVMAGGEVSLTNIDTLPTNIREWGWPSVTAINTTNNQVWHYDDFAINDATGTFQNSWIGPGKTALMVPVGDSSPVQWTPSTGTVHYALVDDVPSAPDEDTTYVSASGSVNVEDWYTLTDLPAEVPATATLLLAETHARWKGNGVTPQVRVRFWDGGAITTGNTTTLTTSYAPTSTATRLVTDLTGKTKANAASFESAVQVIDTLEARCTATWTNIEWIEAASGTNTSIEVPTTVYTGP